MGLTETLTSIKSSSEALLAYANEKTGEGDTDLGEAVRRLADGFGADTIEWELHESFHLKQYFKDIFDGSSITPTETSQILVPASKSTKTLANKIYLKDYIVFLVAHTGHKIIYKNNDHFPRTAGSDSIKWGFTQVTNRNYWGNKLNGYSAELTTQSNHSTAYVYEKNLGDFEFQTGGYGLICTNTNMTLTVMSTSTYTDDLQNAPSYVYNISNFGFDNETLRTDGTTQRHMTVESWYDIDFDNSYRYQDVFVFKIPISKANIFPIFQAYRVLCSDNDIVEMLTGQKENLQRED